MDTDNNIYTIAAVGAITGVAIAIVSDIDELIVLLIFNKIFDKLSCKQAREIFDLLKENEYKVNYEGILEDGGEFTISINELETFSKGVIDLI